MAGSTLIELAGDAAEAASWLLNAALTLILVDLVTTTLLLRRARRHRNAGRLEAAVRLLRIVLALPASRFVDGARGAPVQARLALTLTDLGRLDEAASWALRAMPRASPPPMKACMVAVGAAARRPREPVAADAFLAGFSATASEEARNALALKRADLALECGDWAEMSRAVASFDGAPYAPWRRHAQILGALARGDVEQASRLVDEPGGESVSRVTRAWVLCVAGRGDELDALLPDALATSESGSADPVLLAVAAMRAAQRGDAGSRRDVTFRALEALSRPGPRSAAHDEQVTTRMGLARAALDAGEPAEALRLIEPAASFAHSPRTRHRVAFLRGRALEALGRRSEAADAFDEAQRQGEFQWTIEAGRRSSALRDDVGSAT